MEEFSKIYNRSMKKIIDIIESELVNDPLVDSIKRKYTISVMTDKSLLLTETGPALYEYREYIANDKWDELINKNWEEDVDTIDTAEVGNNDSIKKLIQVLRSIWNNNYGEAERKKITKYIKIMLSEYSKFLLQS